MRCLKLTLVLLAMIASAQVKPAVKPAVRIKPTTYGPHTVGESFSDWAKVLFLGSEQEFVEQTN
jgi:hypothetical protein